MTTSDRPLGADRSALLDETVRIVVPVVLVTSLYLLFAGHNAPGGGFIGGLVATAGFFVRYIAGGVSAGTRGITRLRFEVLLGAGLLISALVGLSPLLVGRPFLQAWTLSSELPVFGTVHLGASLIFDVGVYLVVIGLGVAIVESLGRDADDDQALSVQVGDQP